MNSDIKNKLKRPSDFVPFGAYCYDDDGDCPFWESKSGEYPRREDGYCHFLGKSDWELNEKWEKTSKVSYSKADKELEGKTVEEAFRAEENIDEASGKKKHFGISLLWDKCKECGLNLKRR